MDSEIWVVVAVSLLVFIGLFCYMVRLEGRIRDLEDRE